MTVLVMCVCVCVCVNDESVCVCVLQAREMFDREYEGLKAIQATGTVCVPMPRLALDNPTGGAVLVMEYLDMHGLHRKAGQLGTQLAR